MELVEQVNLTAAEEMMDALSPRNKLWRNEDPRYDHPEVWVYRGQANASWALVPSAWRQDQGAWLTFPSEFRPVPNCDLGELQRCEIKILRKFFLAADANNLSLPEDSQLMRSSVFEDRASPRMLAWPFKDILSLLAIAQHYGVPTRLLDWTRDPKVAAYFAAKGAINSPTREQRLAVWALHKRVFKGIGDDGKPIECVTAPRTAIPNLNAQGGLFSLARLERAMIDEKNKKQQEGLTYHSPLDKIVEFVFGTIAKYTLMICLTLPAIEAPKLLRLLKEERICAASLFPGYDGATESIRELSFLDRLTRPDVDPDIEL